MKRLNICEGKKPMERSVAAQMGEPEPFAGILIGLRSGNASKAMRVPWEPLAIWSSLRSQEQAEADTCGLSLTAWLMPAPPDPLCLPSFQISQKSRNIGLLQSMGKETACVSQEASISALVLRNGVI